MTDIEEIISEITHRPFSMPTGKWKYYQEWNNALFLHWTIPFNVLRKFVPDNLNIDTFEDKCYISLVAFTMKNIRPRYLPSVSFISDFAEINIRTYVENNGKRGVYFLNIEAEKSISALAAKLLSGLPYEKANIHRTDKQFTSINKKKNFSLDTEFEIQKVKENKTGLDKWLTERYCLYLDKGNELYRYDIHHKEWQIRNVVLKRLTLKYNIGSIQLNEPPDLSHYSNGIKVIAWKRKKI